MVNFSKLKLGAKVVIGILVVEFISLASGITMGRNITSHWVILGFIGTILVSQYIAWIVVNNIRQTINDIVINLGSASKELEVVSRTLTSTSHKLAEGSSEQAASIQETSSTLEESASMVHQTTQNTKEADILAKKAKEAAYSGNQEMQTMLSSMEELKKSSDAIAKIIKVIDEIAFQTNILSLNAAVEAARAGDAGKGFAVVAEEVRNLAQRSAQAAKDTAVIIESNIELSEKSLLVTERVNVALGEIRDETNKVSELLEEISTASQEQEIGISQINQAVSQVEIVVQANAATAQESAISADQVADFAVKMQDINNSLLALLHGSEHAQRSLGLKTPPKDIYAKSEKKFATEPKMKRFEKPVMNTKQIPQKQQKVAVMGSAKKTNIVPEDIIPLGDF